MTITASQSRVRKGTDDGYWDGLTLHHARVNGQIRLEIKGFEPSRLTWYKSLGCFTEIVQFKTRLFAPDPAILLSAIGGFSPGALPTARLFPLAAEGVRSVPA